MPVPSWLPRARHTGRSLLLAAALWCLMMGTLLGSWRPLLQALVPLQAAALRSMTDTFALNTLELRRQGADESLVATLRVRGPLRRQDGTVVALRGGATVTASASAAKALLPLALLAHRALTGRRDRRLLYAASMALALAGGAVITITPENAAARARKNDGGFPGAA